MIIKGADGEYEATWKLGEDYVHVVYRKIIHPKWPIFRTKYYYRTIIHKEDFSQKRVRDALLVREHYEKKCACGVDKTPKVCYNTDTKKRKEMK